jgi:hypothetical protein
VLTAVEQKCPFLKTVCECGCVFWETYLNFPMAKDIEMEDENFLELILSNLFRKDSNGEAIDFYLRRTRLGRQDNVEQDEKFKKLKEQIEVVE